MNIIPALFCAALVSGCVGLVPSTAIKLATVSPLEANPEDIAVALVLPQGLRVRENGAKLEMTASRDDTGQVIKGSYTLAEAPLNAAPFGGEDGASARYYAIRPADAAAMRKMQLQVRAWRAEGRSAKGSGSFGVGLDGCTTGAGPAPDAVVSVFVRTEPAGAFMPLIRKAKIVRLLGDDLSAKLKPCDGPR